MREYLLLMTGLVGMVIVPLATLRIVKLIARLTEKKDCILHPMTKEAKKAMLKGCPICGNDQERRTKTINR